MLLSLFKKNPLWPSESWYKKLSRGPTERVWKSSNTLLWQNLIFKTMVAISLRITYGASKRENAEASHTPWKNVLLSHILTFSHSQVNRFAQALGKNYFTKTNFLRKQLHGAFWKEEKSIYAFYETHWMTKWKSILICKACAMYSVIKATRASNCVFSNNFKQSF